MSLQTIDINCDMAEGIGNEAELMPWISSANIACGFHAGNEDLMKSTIELCQKYQVAVGAHPSFPDKENFGRTNMNLPADQIYEMVSAQIHLLKKIARVQGIRVHHVKPHGALYNMAAKDAALAGNIARAVKDLDSTLVFYGLSQSVMIDEAKKLDLRVANEVFADRTYQPDGSLTPRTQPNALIIDEEEAIQQTIRLTKEGKVMTASGEDIQLRADTLCLHGDGKHAVAFAKLIHARLRLEKIKIATIE
jgi:UPF0271 protein